MQESPGVAASAETASGLHRGIYAQSPRSHVTLDVIVILAVQAACKAKHEDALEEMSFVVEIATFPAN